MWFMFWIRLTEQKVSPKDASIQMILDEIRKRCIWMSSSRSPTTVILDGLTVCSPLTPTYTL